MIPLSSTPRRHGFRLSWLDGMVLLAGFALSVWLLRRDFPLAWVVPVVVGHFFLFCNVFLVWRRLELLWAGVFVINVGAHVAFNVFDFLPPLMWQVPMTGLVIALQMRSPWYHGIFARRINPRLADYLNNTLQ